MRTKIKLPPPVAAIYRAVAELEALYPPQFFQLLADGLISSRNPSVKGDFHDNVTVSRLCKASCDLLENRHFRIYKNHRCSQRLKAALRSDLEIMSKKFDQG